MEALQRRLFCQRQGHGEGRRARIGLHFYASSVQFGCGLRDGKAQAEARRLALAHARLVRTVEAVEQVRQVLRRDGVARIADRKLRGVVLGACETHGDGPRLRGVLAGVFQQRLEQSLQTHGVTCEHKSGLYLVFDNKPALEGHGLELQKRHLHQLAQVHPRHELAHIHARIRLGELYGTPSEWDSLSEDIVESEEHKALSLRMAEESIVLLQNKDGILPLSKDVKIALIGPNSDDREMMWGNYNPVPKETVTLKDALEQRNPGLVSFRACGLLGAEFAPANTVFDDMDMSEENLAKVGAQYGLSARDIRRQVERFRAMRNNFLPALDVDETLAKLEGIDVVVFAGGISPKLEGEEMPVNAPGFSGGDKTDINLPAVQKEVLKALHDAGKKVILVNFSGSAIGFAEEQQTCDAILQAWYPGQMGGTAIANILYGDAVPSGKLPVTFYESTDQLPDFGNYDMKGHTYRYFTGKPVYEFGYGLSYTTFKYRKPRIRGGNIVVRVRNTGKAAADEIVQVYVHKDGDSDGPVKTLRGFRRVSIPAHRSVKVKIPVTDATFEWWDGESGRMQPGKGGFDVFVGSSSADANLTKIHYTVK